MQWRRLPHEFISLDGGRHLRSFLPHNKPNALEADFKARFIRQPDYVLERASDYELTIRSEQYAAGTNVPRSTRCKLRSLLAHDKRQGQAETSLPSLLHSFPIM
jgi:hypothetical protein